MNSLFKMLFLMANGQLTTFGSVKLSILQYQIFGIVMVPAQPYSVIKVCNMISFSFSLWQSKHADISSSPALLFATNPKQRHAKSAAGISGWSCAVFGRQHRWQWRRSKSFCKAIPCSTFVCLFLTVPFNNMSTLKPVILSGGSKGRVHVHGLWSMDFNPFCLFSLWWMAIKMHLSDELTDLRISWKDYWKVVCE